MENNNTSDTGFSHVLQRTGILKNFSISKTITLLDLENIKKEAKKNSKSDEEYKKLFQESMSKLGNMHDSANPVPGIIYAGKKTVVRQKLDEEAKKWAKKLKAGNISKDDLTYLVSSIIIELDITEEDFGNLDEEDVDD